MGYVDAVKDGIRIVEGNRSSNGNSYFTKYYPRCEVCGNEFCSGNYIRGNRYICKECRAKESVIIKERCVESSKEEKDKRFERAVDRIRLVSKLAPYKEAIDYVKSSLYDDGSYESTEEIMVALELGKNNVAFRHQVPFGRYRADFVLDSMKVVLEVDGPFHNESTKGKERIRDGMINLELGGDWEVIRIKTSTINMNITRLMKAINAVLDRRRIERAKNHGLLSDKYSDAI